MGLVKVVFVGDEPSSRNALDSIPFVGANCFNRLVEWINFIKPDYYICYNSSFIELLQISVLVNNGFKVVALGNKAAKRLDNHGLVYYRLGHPSGLNRKNNDDAGVKRDLEGCKAYVRE